MNSPLLKTDCIHNINFKETFEQLSEDEKNYIYFLSKACWAGQPIVLFQTSYESPALFIIFQIFFSSFKEFSEIKTILLKNNISDINYSHFLNYVANFYSNFGNYHLKKKIIPNIELTDFEAILKLSPSFNDIHSIWDIIKYIIYDSSENSIYINLEEKKGKNGYYLGWIKEDLIKKTDKILRKNNYSLLNTRLIMLNSSKVVTLIGSIEEKQKSLDEENILLYGEYSSFLKRVNEFLENAKKYTTEKEIIDDYIDFFQTGDIEKHKECQKKWVKENSSIDFNLGWNESVVDPMGVRGLFEGFVGIADNFRSQKYEQLVKLIPQLINELPWNENFELEEYSVSFNSLEVISFARNGSPFGKCLPKYYEIKENFGTKNILFFNACPNYNYVISNYFFCDEADLDLIKNFGRQSIKILTSLKQLMGYGSGKLLRVTKNENDEEIYNFDKELINPLTDKVVDKYYLNNETFEEKFLSYAPILDECRALLIGLFFGENKPIQELFYVNKSDFKNVTYTIWLLQLSRAIVGLKFYNEVNKTCGYPYTQAVWIFMNYILESQQEGEEEIIKINIDEEKEKFKIQLNKEALLIYGKELISKLMIKIHIWKCTGDVESAVECINHYSEVNEKYLKIKKYVENSKQTTRLFLFHNLIREEDGTVIFKEYEESLEGIIESNLDRFGTEYNKDVYNQWVKYATNFIKI
jgi:dipeptidyl-peptidase-3